MIAFILLLCSIAGVLIFRAGKSLLSMAAPSDIRTSRKYLPRWGALQESRR